MVFDLSDFSSPFYVHIVIASLFITNCSLFCNLFTFLKKHAKNRTNSIPQNPESLKEKRQGVILAQNQIKQLMSENLEQRLHSNSNLSENERPTAKFKILKQNTGREFRYSQGGRNDSQASFLESVDDKIPEDDPLYETERISMKTLYKVA